MDIESYKEYREVYKDFTYKIFDVGKGGLKRAAKRLNMLDGDTIIFDDDEEMSWLMDFVLYEKNGRPDRLIDQFKRQDRQMSIVESHLLDSLLENKSSLYEIIGVDAEAHMVTLLDLISKEELEIMDIGLSSNASIIGRLLFTRLIPIEETNMTSGLLLLFAANRKMLLLKSIRKRSVGRRAFKLKNKNSQKTLFEKMVECYRRYGEEFLTIKPSEYQSLS